VTQKDFIEYIAALYARKASDKVVMYAVNIAISNFGSAKPWSFLRGSDTLTSDANGVIELPDDFNGVHSLRQQSSSSGGEIYIWPESMFDSKVPRLDNLSGSYPLVCKIYEEDGVSYGQLAPPVASMSIYLNYHKKLTSVGDIDDDVLPGLVATVHPLMIRPSDEGYAAAILAKQAEIKDLWKKDKKVWSTIWRTMDATDVNHYVTWWGVWAY